jgi:hypothetical protein
MVGFGSSDIISLLSVYLAMVAILASIFFTRLESWHSEIQVAVGLWNPEKYGIDFAQEHRKKALSLQSSRPLYGFYLVSLFILLISGLGYSLGNQTPNTEMANTYILLPGAAFDILFFLGSGILLISGKCDIDELIKKINEALKPRGSNKGH